jgi:MSHA biogenesis protein MshL
METMKINPFIKLSIVALLTSCTVIDPPKSDVVAKVFNEPVKKPKSNDTSMPDAVTQALVPDFDQSLIGATSQGAHTGPLNISVQDVAARDFFMGLVVDSNENMMVHPEVTGTISLELKNVTIPQVMDAVQKIYGYDYKKSEMGYIVYPATLQTKTFKINRLDLLREGKSNTQVTSGQIGNGNQGNQGNNSNSNYGNRQQSGNNAQQFGGQSGSRSSGSLLTTITDTDFWKELDTALHSIISVDKDATLVVNKQSGVIVARAKPMQLREIESFLSTTQNQIGRQVTLEAKILEVILDDSHQAGVNWENVIREGIKKAPYLTGVGALAAMSSQVFTIGGSAGDFRAFVEMLETQGKTNILSSPKISTLNNQKAIIKVGKDQYFITQVSSNVIASASTTTVSPNITFTPFFSGIALDVTPQIDDDQNITLHIHPSITRVESQNINYTINKEDNSVPMALSTVRESDSVVKAENGQIIVLGGLMQESVVDVKEGVAGFTEIPFIGNLFRVNKSTRQKSELIILLKPTIINTQSDWQNIIQPSKQNFERLDALPRWK